MYIADLRHFAGAVEDPSAPAQAKQMALFLNAIVEDGRDVPLDEALPSFVPCMAGPAKKWCLGILEVSRKENPSEIHWCCPQCKKAGVIHDYEDARTPVGVR